MHVSGDVAPVVAVLVQTTFDQGGRHAARRQISANLHRPLTTPNARAYELARETFLGLQANGGQIVQDRIHRRFITIAIATAQFALQFRARMFPPRQQINRPPA